MSKVSVIIPNYNRDKLISETIQNMLNQSLSPYEIIVIDDGSTDNSVNVIRSFGERVTLIQQENQGPGAARNAGLAVATGDYIQFMDSDDLASLNKLELQVAVLEKFRADVVYSPWAKVYIRDGCLSFEDHILQTRSLPSYMSILEWVLSGWSIVLQTCLFRSQWLKQIKPFRKDLLGWEDTEYMVRAFAARPKTIFAPGCLTLYRLHNYGKLTESGTSELRRLRDRISTYPEFWKIINTYSPNIKYTVRLNIGREAWQLWIAMQKTNEFSLLDMNSIMEIWRFYPSFVWHLLGFFRRVLIRLRFHITGSRWIHPYQSSFPSETEYSLVKNLNLDIMQ